MLSRKAICDSHGQDSSYFLGLLEYDKNPYDELKNLNGIIQMGLAENQLSYDLLESWIVKNPDAIQLKINGESLLKELALFQDYYGLPAFKNEFAKFMATCRGDKVKYNPDQMVLTAGATAANETLMFCLADTGDAFLVPTPYYPGFDRDLKWRTGAEIIPVHCSSSNDFKITMSALEEAYQHAQKLHLNVKGILVTNPTNPLGITLSIEELNQLINFSIAKEIHIVSDEVYSGTVFEPPRFTSILKALLDADLQNTEMWKRVHIVYSLSKDLGIPGFRVGMIYSNDKRVISAATKMSSFGLISSQTQYFLSRMLSDENFTRKYIDENQNRLKKRKEMMVSGLSKAGIKCIESNSGLFCWVDMRQLLSSNTFQAEKELWKDILYKVGLNISPGSSFHCSEPGWFRMCFANMSEETLNLAMKRMLAFVGGKRQLFEQGKTLSIFKLDFWLSSSYDEVRVSSL